MTQVMQPCDTGAPVTSHSCGSHLLHERPSHGSGVAGAWFTHGYQVFQVWLTHDAGMADTQLRHSSPIIRARQTCVSCMGYMSFTCSTHVTHSLLTNVFRLLRRGWHVAHAWPSRVSRVAARLSACGSSIEHVCFTRGSHVVQECHMWFNHASGVAQKWLRWNPGVAPTWLMWVSHMVQECFTRDSGVAPTWCRHGSAVSHM